MIASGPDLLRLVVLPIFAWAAWRDVNTRRLPNRLWPPLAALGIGLLVWEAVKFAPFETFGGRLFLVQVAISLLFVAPLGYGFWWVGGFGGADAKALIVLAILLPTFPVYTVGGLALPLVETPVGVFSLTVLTNTVLFAAVVPIFLALGNLIRGNAELRAMFFARPVTVDSIPDRHGKLFETPDGITRRGLDLDALRMYLRWRGTTLAALQTDPDGHRNPDSVDETHDPTDGGTHVGPRTDGGVPEPTEDVGSEPIGETDREATASKSESEAETEGETTTADPWAAEQFFDSIEGSAYGSTPDQLREALELLSTTDRQQLWVSPGLPFVVPMFFGLLIAFSYGDLLFGLFGWLGLL